MRCPACAGGLAHRAPVIAPTQANPWQAPPQNRRGKRVYYWKQKYSIFITMFMDSARKKLGAPGVIRTREPPGN